MRVVSVTREQSVITSDDSAEQHTTIRDTEASVIFLQEERSRDVNAEQFSAIRITAASVI